MKPHCMQEVGHDPHNMGSTIARFLPFDLYNSVHKSPRVTPPLAKCKIKSQPLDLTNENDGYEYV